MFNKNSEDSRIKVSFGISGTCILVLAAIGAYYVGDKITSIYRTKSSRE